jgi:hypothetical protein
VQCRYRRKKDGGLKVKKVEADLGRGHHGEGRTTEVNLSVQEENVESVLAKHEGGRGMENSIIHKPSGRHDCGGLNRRGRRASSHITGKGGDAEMRVLSSE